MTGGQGASVAAHYERWPFPGTPHGSREGLVLLRRLMRWLPVGDGGPRPRILDAGCGTGHTAVALALRMPHVDIVGIDVSDTALAQARSHADEAGVSSVAFRHADLRDPLDDLGHFDVVLALGVLHHIPDFHGAFAHVTERVAATGHLVLWLYGRHGRAQHALHQRFLALLDEGAPEARESTAGAFLTAFGARHVAGSGVYTPVGDGQEGVAFLRSHPSWLADQMFPPYERPVTLDDLFAALDARGLAFEHWFGVPEDPERWVPDGVLRSRFERLGRRDRLRAIECLLRPAYYFISARRSVGRDAAADP